jgi:hypothetical protein
MTNLMIPSSQLIGVAALLFVLSCTIGYITYVLLPLQNEKNLKKEERERNKGKYNALETLEDFHPDTDF